MKGFDFRKKHRKLKQDISNFRINILKLRSLIKNRVSKKDNLNGKLQPTILILRTGDEIGDAIIATGLAKKLYDEGYQVNANITIGFNKSKYPMYSKSIEFMDIDIHITERYKKVLDFLGIETTDYEYLLGVSESDEKTLSDKVSPLNVKYLIAFNPLTSSLDKNLSKKQVEDIIYFIKDNYHSIGIILIGRYNKISEFKTDECIVFPESTISFATAIEKNADLIITPDTSIVHLSRAFNKKMVAIYNNGRIEETGFLAYNMWLPGYENSTVIRVNTPNISEFDSKEIITKVKEIIPPELLKISA